MKTGKSNRFRVFLSGHISSWTRPWNDSFLIWSAVFIPEEELPALRSQLASITHGVAGRLKRHLNDPSKRNDPQMLGHLAQLLGSVWHISEARRVQKNGKGTVDLMDEQFPEIFGQIDHQLDMANAEGVVSSYSFFVSNHDHQTKPKRITLLLQTSPEPPEFALSDFCSWAEGQRLWQETVLDHYGHQVRDFERHLREFPLLGAEHPLAGELRQRIGQARSQTIDSSVWVRGRLWERGKVLRSSEMGAPPPEVTTEGRYNHAGRPVLYLSSDDATCGAELVGQYEARRVWLQDFQVGVKHVLDLASFPSFEEELEIQEPDILLAALHLVVGRPLESHGNWRPEYYVPRFIADLVRHQGYDGILYNSVKGNGVNLALFNPTDRITRINEPRITIYSAPHGILQLDEAQKNTYQIPCRYCRTVTPDLYRYCLACDRQNPDYPVDPSPESR